MKKITILTTFSILFSCSNQITNNSNGLKQSPFPTISSSPIPSSNGNLNIPSNTNTNNISAIPDITGNFEIYSRSEELKKVVYDDKVIFNINLDNNGNGFLVTKDGLLQKIEKYQFTTILDFLDRSKYGSTLNHPPIVKINSDGKGIIHNRINDYVPDTTGESYLNHDYREEKKTFFYNIDNFKIVNKKEDAPPFTDVLIDKEGSGFAFRTSRYTTKILKRTINNYSLSDKDEFIEDNKDKTLYPISIDKSNNTDYLQFFFKGLDKSDSLWLRRINYKKFELDPLLQIKFSETDNITSVEKLSLDNDGNGFMLQTRNSINIINLIKNYNVEEKEIHIDRDIKKQILIFPTSVNKNGNGIIMFKTNSVDEDPFDEYNIDPNQFELSYKKIINYKVEEKEISLGTFIEKYPTEIKINENGDGILLLSSPHKIQGRYIKNYEIK
jgi:hypothetical protein